SPGFLVRVSRASAVGSLAGLPSTAVMTSPASSPALAAGPPGATAVTYRPDGWSVWLDVGMSTTSMPKYECVTAPCAMSSSETALARSTGMAKPNPMLPLLAAPGSLVTDAAADGMPIM